VSGLFHRLAAQALGRPSPLRPGVRLPLAPGPGLLEEPLHPPAPGVAPAPPRPARLSPGPGVGAAGTDLPPIAGDGPRGEREDAAAERGERAPLARPAPMPPPAPPVERPVPPAGGPRDAPQPVDARRASAESVVTEEPARRAVAPPAVAGGDRRTGHERMPALPGNPEQRRPAVPVAAPRPRVAPGPAGWKPLLPEQPVAPIPASPARWPAPGEPAPSAEGRDRPVTEVTEVHVSIGRIEVTAPRGPAPKPGPRPSDEGTPMSLDEYLTRRERART